MSPATSCQLSKLETRECQIAGVVPVDEVEFRGQDDIVEL
jgi:hypothetical protein